MSRLTNKLPLISVLIVIIVVFSFLFILIGSQQDLPSRPLLRSFLRAGRAWPAYVERQDPASSRLRAGGHHPFFLGVHIERHYRPLDHRFKNIENFFRFYSADRCRRAGVDADGLQDRPIFCRGSREYRSRHGVTCSIFSPGRS